MSKVIMTCGKICSGKTTYAERLSREYNAVILSIDGFMLALFGQYAGERHDDYVNALEKILFEKSADIVRSGANVILDWGFWTKIKRQYARKFYASLGIECEIHYIDINSETWKQRLRDRNDLVLNGKSDAYYIDDNLMHKFEDIFETPAENEIDVCIKV